MSFEDENTCFWKKKTFDNYSNEFECDDPDKDYILLENDDYSITTDNTSEVPSTPATTINDNNCFREFLFDYKAYQNAKEKVDLNEHNEDNITWEDMDSVEKDSASTTVCSNTDKEYQISNIEIKDADLIPCVLIDVFDGQVKRCPNYEKPENPLCPLRQLVGTWEIDETAINQTNPES